MDGHRTVGRIHDELTAGIGPVPPEEVSSFLDTLATLGAITR